MAVLCDIRTMQIIVVFNCSMVPIVNLDNKLQKLLLINYLVETINVHNSGGHYRHLHVPAHGL